MTGFGKTLRMRFFPKIEFDKPYHRANSRSSVRPIARFAVELQSFVCDGTSPPIIEKLWSKGVAMHAYGVSVYYRYTRSQLNGAIRNEQRLSEDRISTLITRATPSILKNLKRIVNIQYFDESSCSLIAPSCEF